MTIQGPLAYILLAFLIFFSLGKFIEYYLSHKAKKRADKQIKEIEKKMFLVQEKMRAQALDLQESLTVLNREYSNTIQSYYQKMSGKTNDEINNSNTEEDLKKKQHKKHNKNP